MDNLMDLIFGIVYNDHDSDLIGRDQVDDYTIDTCLTADQGYETAVWVADHNMVIVARYATREEAVLGHYVSLESPIERTHKLNVTAEAEYVMGHLRGGYYNGDLELSEEDYKEFQKAPKTFLLTHPELWEDWPFTVDGYRIDDIGGISEVYFTDQTHRYN